MKQVETRVSVQTHAIELVADNSLCVRVHLLDEEALHLLNNLQVYRARDAFPKFLPLATIVANNYPESCNKKYTIFNLYSIDVSH